MPRALIRPIVLVFGLAFIFLALATADGGWSWNAGLDGIVALFGGYDSLGSLVLLTVVGTSIIALTLHMSGRAYGQHELNTKRLHIAALLALIVGALIANNQQWVTLPDANWIFFLAFMGMVGTCSSLLSYASGQRRQKASTPSREATDSPEEADESQADHNGLQSPSFSIGRMVMRP